MKKDVIQLGQTDMLLLSLLETKDMYGYEIIEVLNDKSNGVFDLKAGTLYPLLHQLEKSGFISGYNSEVSLGRQRKYYHLTEDGKGYLDERKNSWERYACAINQVIGESGSC